ncbi:MAG: hypothetical protein BGO68_03695 [Candidatus Amoebophilus sp. 36-38]|nr:MAG: hypothetical protein BGO68_03695 [Candidatus Amoebophilus sp. 36-38]
MAILNQLANSTSPYLLQHADNPVQWYPWGEEALSKAKQEDKPILLSIGYAACHWCHVMAKESFEDKEVVALMNKHFINIKVDREENPDVDQIAVEALQSMGLQAGWPLHVFLMPNQQPFYGGTYFPTGVWKQLLDDIGFAFKNHRQELVRSSSYFTESLRGQEIKKEILQLDHPLFNQNSSQQIFEKIYQRLDQNYGGIAGSPKFFMPSIPTFLLTYYRLTRDQRALVQLNLALIHMACGEVYDQLGGGFHRYATDETWAVPHFEKMLYDNAQLLSLYAHAYMTTKNSFYKQVVMQTMKFVEREMMDEVGSFYSSLDADSQGVEGTFYTWTYEELDKLLGADIGTFAAYYPISVAGNWERGLNILYRDPDLILDSGGIHQATIEDKLAQAKEILFAARCTIKPRPERNEQVIASWNGMMLQALLDAYYVLGDTHFLKLALKNASYIQKYLMQGQRMRHSYSQGKPGRDGYLEDYVWVARAFISLYEATFQEDWLDQADQLVQHVFNHFGNSTNDLFYFINVNEPTFIKRTQEVFDQVIPSSNAVMAHTLFLLGRLLNREVYTRTSKEMLSRIRELLQTEPLYMAHWAHLYLLHLESPLLVTLIGTDSTRWGQVIKQHHPDILLAGSIQKSTLPTLAHYALEKDRTAVHICSERACYITLYNLEDALLWLKDWKSKPNRI